MESQVHVSSEIAQLKRVIVHRPDEGISRISPKRAEELLFDDIVYLPRMQEEHDIFTEVLSAFIGQENILETQILLTEALQNDKEGKAEMIDMIISYEELPGSYKEIFYDLSDDALAKVLITGYLPERDIILFDPIPNFLFARDIAVTVNDHVIITKPSKEARFRENFLTRFIFSGHPIFKKLRRHNRIINLNKVDQFPPSRRGEQISIEGGDIMIMNKDYLLIGCSERTNAHAIHSLKNVLFDMDVIDNVVQVNIPSDRTCMHIDTIFTQIDHQDMVVYKPIVLDGLSSYVEVFRKNGASAFYHSVGEFIHAEINPNMNFILSGNGESPYQEREQWTDGCNLFTIRPGIALTYDRNPKTEIAFQQNGYTMLHAYEFLKGVKAGTINPSELTKTIITLPSNELSRARGGTHCMTCPIERI